MTRSYVGEYCTSLDMAGASLTLVKLDDELNDLFDAPAEVAVAHLLGRSVSLTPAPAVCGRRRRARRVT